MTNSARSANRRRNAGSGDAKTDVVMELIQANRFLTQEIVRLAQLVIEGRQPAPMPNVGFSTEPLYKSEEVEDAEFDYSRGLLDKDSLQKVLERAGYQNTKIDLP